jgi:hypothetical protein
VFVNGRRAYANDKANLTAKALGFSVPPEYEHKTADILLSGVIKGFVKLLKEDFEKGWSEIMKWDKVSFRSYLETEAKWPESVIYFVEIVCSQANQYALSFPEMIMQNLDFGEKKWFSIANGMDRLSEAAAEAVGLDNISYGAQVYRIDETEEGISVWTDGARGVVKHAGYDRVLLAIPPSAVRMITERPRWSSEKEQAIRAMHFEPLYKIGLRFKTRFWERGERPSLGGQSITDLASRWIVYPSYGRGDDGPGVLLLYSWMSDASVWASIPPDERVKRALRDLAKVYPEVNIYAEFMDGDSVLWSNRTSTGDCMFLPGQFTDYHWVASRPEGSIYFAGEHLSRHHTWIAGALESAYSAIKEMIVRPLDSSGRPGDSIPFGLIHMDDEEARTEYDAEDYRKGFTRDRVNSFDYEVFEKTFVW